MGEYLSNKNFSTNNYGDDAICTKTYFCAAARELGYVNGYRYGVEYPTNGEKPDLPGDVLVVATDVNGKEYKKSLAFSLDFFLIRWFKITDNRYKPADTSYLDKADSSIDSESSSLDNDSDWFDYTNQKALRLPPVGCRVLYSCLKVDSKEAIELGKWYIGTVIAYYDECVWTSDNGIRRLSNTEFKPLDWNRKAEAERKRVVDAALQVCGTLNELALLDLYDLGFLRMPEDK